MLLVALLQSNHTNSDAIWLYVPTKKRNLDEIRKVLEKFNVEILDSAWELTVIGKSIHFTYESRILIITSSPNTYDAFCCSTDYCLRF